VTKTNIVLIPTHVPCGAVKRWWSSSPEERCVDWLPGHARHRQARVTSLYTLILDLGSLLI